MITGIQQQTANSNHQSASSFRTLLALAFLFFFSLTTAKAQSKAAATFVGADTSTQGSWEGKYGADGFSVANDAQSLPSYAALNVQNNENYTWVNDTSDPRALQSRLSGGRIASCWYNSASFYLDLNLTDGQTHEVAIYALDWDDYLGGRSETIQILDANSNAVLDSRSISSFTNGLYLTWNLTGHVHIVATMNAGGNAVISGIFFSPASTTKITPATASFVGLDKTTQGNWMNTYGTDGYSIANSTQSLPSYASFSVSNNENYTWANGTSDPRALQISSGATRIASCWYNSSTFNFDINLTDGNTHQIAFYALDWDDYLGGRSETIQILDANSNAVLDSRSISSFTNGLYLIWNLSGHVRMNITMNAGGNAVINGIFFGGAATSKTAPAVSAPTTTPSNTGTLILNASAASLSFGSVNVSSSSIQNVTFTNAGTASMTISNVSLTGAGFNASGLSAGTILAPGQSATLTATFAPAAAGSVTGSITVSSNANKGTNVVTLSGSGTAAPVAHSVNLQWAGSTSTVVGYNVYVSTVSGGTFTKLTSSPVPTTNYTDSGLQTAQTRYYVVTSINSSNQESAYSNEVQVVIP